MQETWLNPANAREGKPTYLRVQATGGGLVIATAAGPLVRQPLAAVGDFYFAVREINKLIIIISIIILQHGIGRNNYTM